jgi:hypothetical protein
MSATARKHDPVDPVDPLVALEPADGPVAADSVEESRGARGRRAAREHLRMVSPMRPERASRGVFALVVTGMLVVGMVVILVINTSLAQGAFTISELQAQEAALTQQEQTLSEQVEAAAAPESLEQQARSLGMVPSENPVFLSVPSGRVLGKPKPAGGATTSFPRLLTPADATVSEAVDNGGLGADQPVSPGADYDPAAADAAAAQAQAANEAAAAAEQKAAEKAARANEESGAAKGAAAKKGKNPTAENNLWQDSTVIDVTGKVSSGDAGLVAVPVP